MFFMSRLVFNNFYFSSQNKIFINIYEKISGLEEIDVVSPEFRSIVEMCRQNNCAIEVYDSSTNKRIYSPYTYETDTFTDVNSKEIFDNIIGSEKSAVIINGINENYEAQQAINNLNGQNNAYSLLIRHNDSIYILVQTPMEIKNTYQTMLSKVFLWCLALSAFTGIMPAYFLSKDMMMSILEINNVTKKIAEHDFSEKCENNKLSEFYDLCININKMAESLEQQMNEIEEQNKILEHDLDDRKKIEISQKEFVSNVSHELKTPISIISGYAEGIKYGLVQTEEDKNKYCDTIINECSRMRNIVKQLLDLSALENITLNIERNSISDLSDVLIEKFAARHKERHFINNVKAGIHAMFDYDEIERVLTNYLENAVKYTNGDIIINSYEDTEYVKISVISNGHINKADSERIWDRFYRADKSHKRSENSTGLGLSIVKATMQKHNMPYGVDIKDKYVDFYIKLSKK